MAGYILAGAGIGVATAGIGQGVLNSFSTAATSGVNLGQAAVAYGTAGAASGAFGGGAFAGLAGQNVGRGALNGLLWGGASGIAAGGLQHLAASWYVHGQPFLAETDPPYSTDAQVYGALKGELMGSDVIIKGQRLAYAGTGAVQPNYFFEDLFTGGAIFKGLGAGLKYGAGFFGRWFGRNSIEKTPDVLRHIFRNAPNHVSPNTITSQNRFIELFENVANNSKNIRPDAVTQGILPQAAADAGVKAFTQNFKNGQVWVFSRNGRIHDAGINLIKR